MPNAKIIPIRGEEPIRPRLVDDLEPDLLARLMEFWAFVQRRLAGDYCVDDLGFDPEFNDKVLMAMMRPLYKSWFRVEASGLENIPDTTGALVVANHSGVIALDAVMTQVALLDDHPSSYSISWIFGNTLPFRICNCRNLAQTIPRMDYTGFGLGIFRNQYFRNWDFNGWRLGV